MGKLSRRVALSRNGGPDDLSRFNKKDLYNATTSGESREPVSNLLGLEWDGESETVRTTSQETQRRAPLRHDRYLPNVEEVTIWSISTVSSISRTKFSVDSIWQILKKQYTLTSVFSDEMCTCSEIHPDSGVSAVESNPMLALLSATFPDATTGISRCLHQ